MSPEFTCSCGSSDCWREEVDIGVGTMYGPWRCNACGVTHRDQLDADMEMIEEEGPMDLEDQLDKALDRAFPDLGRDQHGT